MKIKSTLTLTIALLFIFTACKKEEIEETEDTSVKRRPVYAGVSDSLMNSGEYNPVIQFNFAEIDSVNNAKYAYDSIDIDADGSIDFKFKARGQIVERPPQSQMDRIVDLWVVPANGYTISYYTDFETNHYGSWSVNYAIEFEYGKEIQLTKRWHNSQLYMYAFVYHPLLSGGMWIKNSTEDRYLGIRLIKDNEEKFGWIRIRKIAHDNIAIVGYAIEK